MHAWVALTKMGLVQQPGPPSSISQVAWAYQHIGNSCTDYEAEYAGLILGLKVRYSPADYPAVKTSNSWIFMAGEIQCCNIRQLFLWREDSGNFWICWGLSVWLHSLFLVVREDFIILWGPSHGALTCQIEKCGSGLVNNSVRQFTLLLRWYVALLPDGQKSGHQALGGHRGFQTCHQADAGEVDVELSTPSRPSCGGYRPN